MTQAIKVVINVNTMTLHTPFEALDLIKTIPGRKWNPERKVWTVPTVYLAEARQILSSWPHPVHWEDRRRKSAPSSHSPVCWADALYAALPPHLHQAAFRALVRVLHPDTGGDKAAMTALNLADERRRQRS